MARINSSLIGHLQGLSLEKKINTSVNTADLNWLGNDCSKDISFEKFNIQANINRVLLWLASKENDYVREDIRGGVLYGLLAQKNNDMNLSHWEEIISERFNEDFAQDLELLFIKLSTNTKDNILNLSMIVRDRISNITFPISTGAAL